MRRLHNILLICIVFLPVLQSCNKRSPAYYRNNIIGHWIVDTYDDAKLNEKDFTVMSFNTNYEVVFEGRLSSDDGNFKWGKNALNYNIYCCDFSIYGIYKGFFGFTSNAITKQEYDFVSVEDSLVTVKCTKYIINKNEVTPEYSTMTMRKIPNTYAKADSLYGIWQFKTKNGKDFSNYRIQFKTEGATSFYMRDANNQWSSPSAEDYYNKYHDFLAITLFNNSVFGRENLWDIACFTINSLSHSAGTMNLSSGNDEYVLSYISPN